ncbi:MAG: ATP-binding cassette domain-containing protein [Clostridia bacterium]|nr:ATP-binding cassette domain-containing protein [Clostridia bacterium]MBR4623196.1 ATP-binding cassette domain-containing protein [Clostridia bacterium]MBR6822162.1 ATP-binding cassette domain-containing protein [Clostridia bacterium]
MKDALIKIRNVSKKYGEQTVLYDITLDIPSGSCTGFVGNNGSGKTVLFKCICGFVKPTKGYIEVREKRIGRDSDFIEDTGIIIENPGFLGNLTGYRNLELLSSINNKIDRTRILSMLEQVGLDDAMNKKVRNYSLGMRQRLGIAQAIMEKPSILILDEPFNGLDREGLTAMRELVRSMNEEGTTVLISSHNSSDIELLCDRVIELDGGKMINEKRIY